MSARRVAVIAGDVAAAAFVACGLGVWWQLRPYLRAGRHRVAS